MNIWRLNWIFQINFYSLPLQTDITAAVRKCYYILTVNCVFFFYQWLVNLADQHKFIIIIHWDQEHFNIIYYEILKLISLHATANESDILCVLNFYTWLCQQYNNFSRILNKHINHLHQVFQLFQNLDINLELKKFYLDYLTVILLKQ